VFETRRLVIASGFERLSSKLPERWRRTLDWRIVPFAVGLAMLAVILATPQPLFDARAYWLADSAQPYLNSGGGEPNAYLYSPAFLQLISTLRALPWEWFGLAWLAITAASLVLLTRHWLPIALLIPITGLELAVGNIHFLLSAAVVASVRYPAAWSFILLTKVTPGVGLIWYVMRREWRNLAIALGATALVVAVSFALAPAQWPAWIGSLGRNAHGNLDFPLFPVPLLPRLGLAAALIAWGARSNRRWTLLVGATLALPILWPANLAMLAGLPLLINRAGVTRSDPVVDPAPSGPPVQGPAVG
jgi:Glycosyltransferase family 87